MTQRLFCTQQRWYDVWWPRLLQTQTLMHVKVNICWSPSGAGTRGREAGDTFVTQPRQVLSSENCGCLTRYLHIYISNYLDIYTEHRLRSCTKNKRKPRHQLTASPAARPPRPPCSRADYQMCKQRPDTLLLQRLQTRRCSSPGPRS